MDTTLRLTLLVIGVAIIILIYVWGRTRGKRLLRTDRNQALNNGDIDSLSISAIPPKVEEVDSDLNELGGLVAKSRQTSMFDPATLSSDEPLAEAVENEKTEAGMRPINTPTNTPIPSNQISQHQDPSLIIVMNVVAREGRQFLGNEILEVLDSLGMQLGEKEIFHHFGVGQITTSDPVFSLANIVEPGIFDLGQMDDLTTPGLALFMQLPGPVDGRVAFELMLSSAQHLADKLQGELHDEARKSMTPHTIQVLRERISRAIQQMTPA